jgi:hypothetical protein
MGLFDPVEEDDKVALVVSLGSELVDADFEI